MSTGRKPPIPVMFAQAVNCADLCDNGSMGEIFEILRYGELLSPDSKQLRLGAPCPTKRGENT